MDLVLVGLPGSGKTAVGRRLAARHGASFVDLDDVIQAAAGRSIPDIFETEGEVGFRARERKAVADLGPPTAEPELRRVVATGGGAPVDPRNRWRLYRGRTAVWLDGPPEALAQRLRHSPSPRPLLRGRDPVGAIRSLAAGRERFYAAASRVNGVAPVAAVIDVIERILGDGPAIATTLLAAETRIGRFNLGEYHAGGTLVAELHRMGARRAILASEPGAWASAGEAIWGALLEAAVPTERIFLPEGETAKRLSVIETAARELARLRVERTDPIVAIGGGALGDAAGFLAATYLRGVPLIHVPTTLGAQIDSSIGGKSAVDLPEGKNLVGAFHQPVAVIIDVALLRTLPERQRRAALGEAVKMAALGDERLFELLESDGLAIARGDEQAFACGAIAEVVERAAWAKVEIVLADERERGGPSGGRGMAGGHGTAPRAGDGVGAGRLALNLGHSVGHAVEAAGGYADLLHGEAIAHGLRAACRIGFELGVTPAARAARIAALLDRLRLAVDRLPYRADAVRDALAADKKHAGGRLQWVLPTAEGVVVRSDVPDAVVDAAIAAALHPGPAEVSGR